MQFTSKYAVLCYRELIFLEVHNEKAWNYAISVALFRVFCYTIYRRKYAYKWRGYVSGLFGKNTQIKW